LFYFSSDLPNIQELIEIGIFDYILKPIDIPTLLHALKRASFFIDNEPSKKENEITLLFQTSLKNGLKGSADKAQKELLIKVLQLTNFNINQTAKLLGISRENCYYFLKKFNIQRPHD
jgi:DNA-binding NtrC family response regulator